MARSPYLAPLAIRGVTACLPTQADPPATLLALLLQAMLAIQRTRMNLAPVLFPSSCRGSCSCGKGTEPQRKHRLGPDEHWQ